MAKLAWEMPVNWGKMARIFVPQLSGFYCMYSLIVTLNSDLKDDSAGSVKI